MAKAPEQKIRAIIQTTVTPPKRPARKRQTRPAPSQTIVIHGGHNVIAQHGAVVHLHQAGPFQS